MTAFGKAGNERRSCAPAAPRTPDPGSRFQALEQTFEAISFEWGSWVTAVSMNEAYTASDTPPVAARANARCFVSGLTGASSTRDDENEQPFAEIDSAANGDARLRVAPAGANDDVGTFASSLRVD